ncbi:MAG: type II toxin-antitoxin system RnlA family toxin [Clostridia bacterium]|nr:type II toxin-antitoxin system RnlA family toxin [Clostridia bacterium]
MNQNQTERLRKTELAPELFTALIKQMEGAGYERKKFVPTSDVSHFERYRYISRGGEKIALVYDTSAKILTADGKRSTLDEISEMMSKKREIPKKTKRTERKTSPAPKNKKQNNLSQPKPIIIKGVTAKRLDSIIKDLKDTNGIKAKVTTAGFDKTKAITLTDKNKQKLEVIRDDKGIISLIGNNAELLSLLKSRLESKSDVRLLKKHLPTALKYLSESSKIDLSNGITDLTNIGRLSDYSVLLIPPYRALEKFIYDLEQAEGINVKMIGQAFEKTDEGKYTLKKGYIKRINSVVYAEVMCALYTEYSEKRNFYTHSDNTDSLRSRGITEKDEANQILNKLLDIIEYNARKLSEIGFKVNDEK